MTGLQAPSGCDSRLRLPAADRFCSGFLPGLSLVFGALRCLSVFGGPLRRRRRASWPCALACDVRRRPFRLPPGCRTWLLSLRLLRCAHWACGCCSEAVPQPFTPFRFIFSWVFQFPESLSSPRPLSLVRSPSKLLGEVARSSAVPVAGASFDSSSERPGPAAVAVCSACALCAFPVKL